MYIYMYVYHVSRGLVPKTTLLAPVPHHPRPVCQVPPGPNTTLIAPACQVKKSRPNNSDRFA